MAYTRDSSARRAAETDDGDRLPPQDLHSEQAVLGAMLIEPGAVPRGLAAVSGDDFYRDAHRAIYEAIRNVNDREEPVDIVTVTSELRRLEKLDSIGGPAYLQALIRETPTAAHVVRYANIVTERALLRRLISAGSEITALGFSNPENVDRVVDNAESIIFQIAQRRVTRDFEHVGPVVKQAFDIIDERYHKGEVVTGIPTGLAELDEMTAGLQRGDFVVIAGRPSMGKSSLAVNNVALHAATEAKVGVGIFSLEMSRSQLAEGLLCAMASVDAWRIRRADHLRDEDWDRIGDAAGFLAESPIYIDDSPAISVLEMRSKARRLKAEHGVGLLIVDYVQLASVGRDIENRHQEISIIARALKGIARELEIPVIGVSQLSRAVERREDKRPILSDLAESGTIEAEADIVTFLFRPKYYEKRDDARKRLRQQRAGVTPASGGDGPKQRRQEEATAERAELIIAKHRTGPTGTVHVHWVDKYRRFENETRRRTDEGAS